MNLNVNRNRPAGLVSFGVIVGALIYLAAMAYATRSYFVDDAYIGFRYVDNLVAGKGFVFNPPERLEGVTNIGWLAFLAPWSLLGEVSVVAKIVSIALVCATCIGSARMAQV